ncbi:hypothetical protein QE152_g4326 [Popillia japonica]|uniref:Uncharacterized protein n=1 Tax=Popillia japonica TaxID=7064 RepID=A0AAW1N199_POPJA
MWWFGFPLDAGVYEDFGELASMNWNDSSAVGQCGGLGSLWMLPCVPQADLPSLIYYSISKRTPAKIRGIYSKRTPAKIRGIYEISSSNSRLPVIKAISSTHPATMDHNGLLRADMIAKQFVAGFHDGTICETG